jgi:hypothetical protein
MSTAMQAAPAPHSKFLTVFDLNLSLRELINGQDSLENEEFKMLCEKSESSFSLPQFGDDGAPKTSEIFDSVNDLKEEPRKAGGSNGNTKALPASPTRSRRTVRTTSASPPLQQLIRTQEKHEQLLERIPTIPAQVIADLDGFSASIHCHDSKEHFPLLSWSDFLNDDILDTDLKCWKEDQMRTKEEASGEGYKTQKEAIKNRKGSREKVQGQSSAKEVRSKSSSKHSKSEIDTGEREHDRRHRSKSRHYERRQRSSTNESDADRQSRSRSAAPSEANVHTLLGSNRRSNVGLDSSIHSCFVPVKRTFYHAKSPGLEAKAIRGSQRKSQDLDMSTHSVHVSKDIARSRRKHGSGSVLHRRRSLDMGASTHSVHVSKDIGKAGLGKDSDGAMSKGLPIFVNYSEEDIPKGSLRVHSRSQARHRPTASRDAQEGHLGRDEKSDNAPAGRVFEEPSPLGKARVSRRSRRRTSIV